MSGGRIELGIGVGWLKEEFEAVGVPFEKRGKRSDEYIAVMRTLWAEDGASFKGEFVTFDEVSSNPKPVNRAVPIVIGGHSEAAAKRAGRLGDGFFPSIGSQVDTVPLFDVVRRTAEAAGPRSEVGRDHGRLPRPAARLERRTRAPPSRNARAGRRPHRAAGLALPARSRGQPRPLRRDDHPTVPVASANLARNAINAYIDSIMGSLTIRNLDDSVKARLRVQAAQHGRSMEEEARTILSAALPRDDSRDGGGSSKRYGRRIRAASRSRSGSFGICEHVRRREKTRDPPQLPTDGHRRYERSLGRQLASGHRRERSTGSTTQPAALSFTTTVCEARIAALACALLPAGRRRSIP